MSLTLVCLYIIVGLFFLLFVNYKFLKRFITSLNNKKFSHDANSNAEKMSNNNTTLNNKNGSDDYSPSCIAPDTWSIPGPLRVPFLGTKWIYLWKYKMSKIHEVYEDFYQTYGPIVLEVGSDGTPVVNLYSRQDIEKVLRYPSKYPFRPPSEIVSEYRKMRPDRYASTGITNEQGETWHNLRTKLTSQITSPRVLQAFLPSLNCICDDFIDLLRTKRNPKTNMVENFQNIANLFGLEAACTLMLGKRMGFLSKSPPENVAKLAAAVKTLFITQRDSSYGFSLWKYISTQTYRTFVQTEDTIYNIISEIVDTALHEKQSEIVDEDSVNSVFFSILGEKDLDIRDKKSAIIDFIAAGIETLANTLIFVLHYIANQAETMEKINSEFEHCSNEIDSNDLSHAVFTKACLQETYRICPTAFCLARILQEDTHLSGYNVKAGTMILCQNMISCHNPANFKSPNEFKPERWFDDSKANTRCTEAGANLVVPFGVGKRQCPGRRFVEMELVLIVAKMARAFNIDFCDKLELEFEFLLTPKTPINLILNERLP